MNQNRARRAVRTSAALVAAVLLSACASAKASEPAGTHAPVAAPSRSAAAVNAAVTDAGRPGAVALDAAQRAVVDQTAAHAPAPIRKRLRYAVATDDAGKPRLVVYDGLGLGPDGRDPHKPHEYLVFLVLNVPGGAHYDPQQNSLVPPIPPPVQRNNAALER